jgi:predicted Zn-dependent peptidase
MSNFSSEAVSPGKSQDYTKYTLPNGLRLLVSPMPHLRSVSLIVFVGTGSRYEADAEAGVSHFIEHLYFKGTQRRPTSKEISEAIESVGGVLNGGTDKELTTYWCKVADRHLPTAIDLLADLLHNSRLDQADMEKERQIIIEEINMSLDMPQYKVDLLIDELVWPNQAMGRDIAGSKETVTAMTRGQLTDYIGRRYLANNAVISVTGNVMPEAVRDSIEKAFGGWPPAPLGPMAPAKDSQKKPQLAIEKRDSEQAHICLGLRGLSLFDKDRFAMGLLSIVLGEGMSSRLFLEIRERLGLAYDIRCFAGQHLDTGSLIIYAGVDPKKTETAVASIIEQIRLMKETVPDAEVTKAKELAKGRLLLRMEDSRNVAGWLGGQEILTNKIMSIDEAVAKIDALTSDDVKRVARKLLVTEKLNLAVVGPVKRRAGLERLLVL